MRALFAAPAALGLVVAAVLAAPSCGRSDLSKAHDAYDAKVEPLLRREEAVWKKIAALLKEQAQGEEPEFRRFADTLRAETLPFYVAFSASVEEIEPGDPGLAAAQAALVKFATSRAEVVRLFADNLETVRIGDPESKLMEKDAAFASASAAYGESIKGEMATADNRYSELVALQTEFQTSCADPMGEGKATAEDVADRITRRILPKIKSLRATKFLDDEPSRRLRVAIVALGEFFDAVVADLPRMEAAARLRRSSSALTVAGDDALKSFLAEMKAVRGRM